MMYLKYNGFGCLIVGLYLCVFCLVGCSKTEQNKELALPSDLKQLYPQQLTRFDKVDSLYFSFLGINAYLSEDNNIILAVWDPGILLKTDFEGNTIIAKTDAGNGPGETLGIGVPAIDTDGNVYVLDKWQSKIVKYDKNLQLQSERVIKTGEGLQVYQIYPTFKNGELLVELGRPTLSYIDDLRKVMSMYDFKSGIFGDTIETFSKPYSPIGSMSGGQAGSGIQVPFSDEQLIAYKPESKTFLFFDTMTNIIAEIDSKFDTLKAIIVNLPQEKVSQEELAAFRLQDDRLDSQN